MSAQRDGFSLIEVIIAMLILTVGFLAMGATTGYVLKQVRASEFRTDRMVAVRQVTEILRATPWTNLSHTCANNTYEREGYQVNCTVQQAGNLATIQLISEGRGMSGGRVVVNAVDTLSIILARP